MKILRNFSLFLKTERPRPEFQHFLREKTKYVNFFSTLRHELRRTASSVTTTHVHSRDNNCILTVHAALSLPTRRTAFEPKYVDCCACVHVFRVRRWGEIGNSLSTWTWLQHGTREFQPRPRSFGEAPGQDHKKFALSCFQRLTCSLSSNIQYANLAEGWQRSEVDSLYHWPESIDS